MKSRGQLPQERELYGELLRQVQNGQRLARATLVRAWGSTPREVGAKMLVYSDGSIRGTVGGGCGEAEVWQAAMQALAENRPQRVEVDLTEDENSEDGKVCGGRFEVFIDLWGNDRPLSLPAPDREALLVTYLGPEPQRSWRQKTIPARPARADLAIGQTWILTAPDDLYWQAAFRDGRPKVLVQDGQEYYLDPLTQGLELVIAGAGHIARPLCSMASLCGYSVVVIDDRAEYAQAEFFPEGRAVCQPFEKFFADYKIHRGSHIVLVTRGHKYDETCLRQLLGKNIGYLGMIGSRRRTRAVFDDLAREGVDRQWLARIHAPVGLDIGALTPEEIAVSILSEMILFRRGGKGGSLRGPFE